LAQGGFVAGMVDKAAAAEAKAKGNAAFSAKQYQDAIGHFTEAIAHDPTDHVFFSNRSACYSSVEKYSEALEDANQCVKLRPDWAKGYTRKGLAEYFLGKHDEAEATYKKGLELAPGDAALAGGLKQVQDAKARVSGGPDMTALLGAIQRNPKIAEYMKDQTFMANFQMLLQAQTNPQMMPMVSQLLQQDPRMMEVFLAMQGISPEEAQTMGQKREPSPPKTKPKEEPKPEPVDERTDQQKEADGWKEKGNSHFKNKEFVPALDCYNKAIDVLPDELSYYGNKGAVLIEMGRHDECVEVCQGALDRRYEMNANNPGGASYEKVAKLLCRIASSYAKRKEFDKAKDFYEKSLVEDNNRFTRQAMRDLERARERWEKEKMLDPVEAEKHKQAGNEYFKKLDYVNAKKEYDEALKRCPTDATIYANRAAALTKLLAHPDALRDLEEALRLDPQYVKAYHRKGTCHQFMKEYHKALKAYEAGLAIDPNDESCKQGKASVLSTIQAQQSNKEVDEEQVRHAMADPEIQSILKDPQINLVLQQLREDPKAGQDAINKDPKVREAIEKLMFAGILKVG